MNNADSSFFRTRILLVIVTVRVIVSEYKKAIIHRLATH